MASHGEEKVLSQNYIQDIATPGKPAHKDGPYGADALRGRVANLLRRNQTGFPGAQPVSFARKHLDELRSRDYFVCEKSDGIRYLLYLTSISGADGTPHETPFLIDRKNTYWHIGVTELHFPQKNGPDSSFHTDTLIDGELVMDEYPDGAKIPRFIVFDCLLLDGQSLMTRTLDKRLGYFKEMVLTPYQDLLNRYPDEKKYQPFTVELKSMQVAYGIELMFNSILPELKHGNDGLIFTCRGSAYQFGTDDHILKWKPAEENTIDFRWKLDFPPYVPDEEDRAEGVTEPYTNYDDPPRVHLYVHRGRDVADGKAARPFVSSHVANKWYEKWGEMHLPEEEWELMKGLGDPLDERVVEAHMDEQRRWRFLRFRDDKEESNFHTVAESVVQSINDSVTKEELLAAALGIKDKWKARGEQERQERHRQAQARK
ncbi:hypothetical protein MKZ38_007836 [Zalerion maritima]|uniref:mRNA-capping enzyme subunit alpha n=1 Tax=Zalerion maritima TaxID=339359 RepID=A0AAD5RI67_9PEZI|nr:hypothetical protein MKZ38_007836 [Zalerion maritima]